MINVLKRIKRLYLLIKIIRSPFYGFLSSTLQPLSIWEGEWYIMFEKGCVHTTILAESFSLEQMVYYVFIPKRNAEAIQTFWKLKIKLMQEEIRNGNYIR